MYTVIKCVQISHYLVRLTLCHVKQIFRLGPGLFKHLKFKGRAGGFLTLKKLHFQLQKLNIFKQRYSWKVILWCSSSKLFTSITADHAWNRLAIQPTPPTPTPPLSLPTNWVISSHNCQVIVKFLLHYLRSRWNFWC